jgi:xylulokinase
VSATANPLLLAIDAGSDSLRAALIARDGRALAIAKRSYRMTLGESGVAEQDPSLVWSALREAIAVLARKHASIDLGRVAGIGVTAAIGLVVCGEGSTPLRAIMMWQDRRALREADDLVSHYGRNGLFATAGRPIDPELAACKLAWICRHEPGIAARIHTAYTLKDWIVHRLCGERATDPTSASYSLAYDVFAREWNRELLARIGVDACAMPPVLAATAAVGATTRDAARALGLREGIPVAVGGPDGTIGALGAGMLEPGSAVDVIGTTDVVFSIVDSPLRDATSRTITNAYVEAGRWAIGGPLGLTGGALRWLVESFGPFEAPRTSSPFAALDALANAIAPGAEGLVFFPGLAGARVPWWQPEARGAVIGLSARHGRAHIARALLEGCAFLVADTFDAIEHAGATVREVRAAGGGAASATWLAIRASALGRPLVVPEQIEASSLGAAIAAGVAGGVYDNASAGVAAAVRVARVVEPDMAAHARYRELRALMSQLRAHIDAASKALQSFV